MSIDAAELEIIITRVLHEKRSITDESHVIHHNWIDKQMRCADEQETLCEWVRLQIEQQHVRNERWKKFESSFIGGLALMILGWLGWIGTVIYHSWDAVKEAIKP
jgi:hypothetical protein